MDPTLSPFGVLRRSFISIASLVISLGVLGCRAAHEPVATAGDAQPLLAYVGTFSAPLRDVLPTQVDLPPGNGRGIHCFRADRDTGALAAAGVYEMTTSPSCLAVNRAGTRLYSANETDRVGGEKEEKEGTVSAFAIDRS